MFVSRELMIKGKVTKGETRRAMLSRIHRAKEYREVAGEGKRFGLKTIESGTNTEAVSRQKEKL